MARTTGFWATVGAAWALAASAAGQTWMRQGQWQVESLQPTAAQGELTIALDPGEGTVDLYVRRGAAPTLDQYDLRIPAPSIRIRDRQIRVTLDNGSTPRLTNDRWYFAAYARTRSQATLNGKVRAVPSRFAGRGAVPFAGGTTFRVWAPNASAAWVAGQFNNWSATAAPLQPELGGWWSVDVRGAVPGQQYKFVLRNGSQTLWRNDPYARQVTNSVGNSAILDHAAYAWQTNAFATPNWNDLVILQIHVGSFNDTPGGGPGTFASAIQRLDHVRELGVNAINLLPVQEFPGDFSWGYNPSHLFAVESAYGGPQGLKRFVDEANRRGIAVLGDVVHNHYGPGDLDLWQFDGWSQNGLGGIFFYNDARARTDWGHTRPDFGRGEVRQFIRDHQTELLEQYRLSGLRWDSTLNIRRTDLGDNPDGWSLMQQLNDEVDARQPWKISIAEDLQNNEWLTRPTRAGGAGFDAQWSNFVHAVRGAITTPDDDARDMEAIRWAVGGERPNGDPFQRVVYTESHDENANGRQRVPSEIDPSNPAGYWAQKRSTLGAAIALTSPGIPMLFQGQEFLESGWFDDDRPVDWSKATTHAGILRLYRDLVAMRRNLGGRTNGLRGPHANVFHVNQSDKVVAFHRWMNGGPNDDVVVVANFRNTTWRDYRIGFPHRGGWRAVFNSDWVGYSPLFGNLNSPDVTADGPARDGLPASGLVQLAPYSVVVYSRM